MTQSQRERDRLAVFVSYSRTDLAFADQLVVTLELAGFSPTIDRIGIHGAEKWEEKLGTLISEADTVVFVLSPSSAQSKVCAWEVEQAVKLGKRIIPVVCTPLRDIAPPPALSELNYILFYAEPQHPGSGWASGMRELDKALRSDLAWLREHTRLVQRALEWERAEKLPGRLLSGRDIFDAHEWMARQPRHAPAPTTLHLEFIRASEEREKEQTSERQRQLEERENLLREAETAQAAREVAQNEALANAVMARRQAEVTARRTLVGLLVASLLAVVAIGASYWARAKQLEALDQSRAAKEAVAVVDILFEQTRKADTPREERDKEVFIKLNAQATTGNRTAARIIGYIYENGRGVELNIEKAREWYQRAAAVGDTGAMYALGTIALELDDDYAKAKEWYEKAAAAGDANAMASVGDLYRDGHGVTKDYTKAREWYLKGSAAGNAYAMLKMGDIHREGGPHVQADASIAREWYQRAAAAGATTAMFALGNMFSEGATQDYDKALEWFHKATVAGDKFGEVRFKYLKYRQELETRAASGDLSAMNSLGDVFRDGMFVKKDAAKAREWYEKAAAAGNGPANTRIGMLHFKGLAVAQDDLKARDWFEKGAAAGDGDALVNLGALYAKRDSALHDYSKAREWFEKGAAVGDGAAMSWLAFLYVHDLGVQRDYGKAREWLEKGAAAADPTSMVGLGQLYEQGLGVAVDNGKAREWYGNAAARGYEGLDEKIKFLDALVLDNAQARERYTTSLGTLAWNALLADKPAEALTAAERALAQDPSLLWIESYRAHALMHLNRPDEARALYLAHKNKRVSSNPDKLWQVAVREAFVEFRRLRREHPQMAEIEDALGIAKP